MKEIYNMNMPMIYEIDTQTGLSLFMSAAVGPKSDIESVFNLLKEYPAAIMNHIP